MTPGEFYRSGQMGHDPLVYYLKKYKIKSVVNLETHNPDNTWYKDEIAVCKQMGVEHYNYRLESFRIISVEKTKEIINFLKRIPKPILAHCHGGADRSGFVSAIWDYAIKGENAKQAVEQLSWKYFHITFFGGSSIAMNKSFWLYVDKTSTKSKKMMAY